MVWFGYRRFTWAEQNFWMRHLYKTFFLRILQFKVDLGLGSFSKNIKVLSIEHIIFTTHDRLPPVFAEIE